MQLHKIWIEQCEAAIGIEDEFGTVNALKYLVGEKFLSYLQAAEQDADFRAELPGFVAEIKTIFEPWQSTSILRRLDGRSHSIQAFTRRKAKTRNTSRWNARTTCGGQPTNSC